MREHAWKIVVLFVALLIAPHHPPRADAPTAAKSTGATAQKAVNLRLALRDS